MERGQAGKSAPGDITPGSRLIYDRLRYEGFIAGAGADGYRVNVRSTIKRIRKKFLSLDPAFREIETHSTFGYAWHAPEGAVVYSALSV